jgi:Ca2+-binding RTX toxin-like protein
VVQITGTVAGSVELSGTAGFTSVINRGSIGGDLTLAGVQAVYDGLHGGRVGGEVIGNDGQTTYFVSQSDLRIVEDGAFAGFDMVNATVDFTLPDEVEGLTLMGGANLRGTGNGGSNGLAGNVGDNALRGLGDVDTLNGGAGDDLLGGGEGNDFVYGDDGNDSLHGGDGDDQVGGGAGDDWLVGGMGADFIAGNDGDDTMHGGMGADTLDGGAGSDTFRFLRRWDSDTGLGSDRIVGFEPGIDRIDLSDLIPGALAWRGTAALTGTAPEVRLLLQGTGTLVFVDTDGNGVADMRIVLPSVQGLTAGDFDL